MYSTFSAQLASALTVRRPQSSAALAPRSLDDVISGSRQLVITGGGATEAEFSSAPQGTQRHFLWTKLVSA